MGGIITSLIASTILRQVANSRRRRLSSLGPDELTDQKKVAEDIPWSTVTEARLKRTSLMIRTEKRFFLMKIDASEIEAFKTLLHSKVGDRFVVKQ